MMQSGQACHDEPRHDGDGTSAQAACHADTALQNNRRFIPANGLMRS